MKKLALLLAVSLLALSGCGTLEANFFSLKKESTEAVENLTTEAVRIKETVETEVEKAEQAADSVSTAIDAAQEAKEDLQNLTGGSD
ncbi:MAG: hypothetical protein AAB802_05215 [Patescibacteria group bacterium]